MPLEPGQKLSHYRLVEKIGEGGMGVVWKAEDIVLRRTVALKFLPPEVVSEASRTERFILEARAASAINHPHIAQVHEFGQHEGTHFIAMEYIEGKTLRRLARNSEMKLEEFLEVMIQVTDALAKAHRKGIVHRDVKPENIMVNEDGLAKVLDFGLAKLIEQPVSIGELSEAQTQPPPRTERGVVLGTAHYMSPEQARGRPVDARSDIFSLGVVMYEVAAGQLPFQGDSKVEVLSAILQKEPRPVSELNEKVPPRFERVIHSALAKRPDDRYQNIKDLRADLLEVQQEVTGTPALPGAGVQDFSPLRSPPCHKHNLPLQRTPFVGREREVAEVTVLLEDPACRLLTLIGPGGVGKTRLALQAAAEKIENFAHGVHFVSLAPLSSVEFVVPCIADSLKFNFYSRKDPKIQLLDYLREKQMLLLLDNFEHLLRGTGLISEILQNAPAVKLLVTSRERLALQAEWVVEVRAMTYPDKVKADEVEAYDAVQLFLQGARKISSGFSPSEEEMSYIVRICQLVEGMPLGVELASAWVRVLSCQEIAQEIEQNLDFLDTSLRDMPERHRSLRVVLENSWKLLSEEEREGFRRLSVFRGGCDRKAAQELGVSLLTLTSLIDKSLVRRNASGRYEMHGVLRRYAELKLHEVADEEETIQRLYSGYFAEFLHMRAEDLIGSRQRQALEEIGEELENVRTAWHWAVDRSRNDEIEKSLESLYFFYEIQGRFHEGEAAVDRAVKAFGEPGLKAEEVSEEHEVIFGRLLVRQGAFCSLLSRYERARKLVEKSLSIFRDVGNRKETAFSLYHLGQVAYMQGEYAEADQLFREGLLIYREIDNRFGIARCLNNSGHVAYMQGRSTEADRLFRESLFIHREIGDQFGIARCLNNVGNVANMHEHYGEAKQLYRESLAIHREIGNIWGTAGPLNNLGNVASHLGEYAEAKRLYEESLTVFRETGDRWDISNCLNNLADVACTLGEYGESRQYFNESLKVARDIQAVPLVVEALVWMATLLVKQDEKEQAVELLALALGHPAIENERRNKDRAEKLLSRLETELPSNVAAVARERGRSKKLGAVVEEILT